ASLDPATSRVALLYRSATARRLVIGQAGQLRPIGATLADGAAERAVDAQADLLRRSEPLGGAAEPASGSPIGAGRAQADLLRRSEPLGGAAEPASGSPIGA